MPTFGCHNCKADLKAFEDRPYEEWPCAKCALAKNYSHTFCTGYFDTADLDGIEDDGTVDGIHLTDLGFRHYADKMIPVLRPLLYPDGEMRSNTAIMHGEK